MARYRLGDNSRFYIVIASLFTSMLVLGLTRLNIASDQLFVIRLQQIYGLLAVIFLYLALIISPFAAVVGKQKLAQLIYARRAIGVSAWYFAVLHGCVALWGQLGGITQLGYLPTIFQMSLAFGAFGILILTIMALTSFDAVVRHMTFKYWKLLHRLIYLGGIAILLHVWMVGTHLAYLQTQLALGIAVTILLGLESYRTLTALRKNKIVLT